MGNWEKAVENVYSQKEKDIIIGLTGRTGSGCTTLSSILKSEKFSALDLHDPKSHGHANANERKYEIIYNFVSNDGVWEPFTIIEGSSIIFSFVLQTGYDDFLKFLSQLKEDSDQYKVRIAAFNDLLKAVKGMKHLFECKDLCCIENEKLIDLSPSDLEKYYKFFIDKLPKLKKEFQDAIKDFVCYQTFINKLTQAKIIKSHFYTFLFQQFGNNIRCSGSPYCSNFTQNNFFDVAKRMDAIVKLVFLYNRDRKKRKTRICIDAIRNSYEAYYFKDRYSSFYLVSVNTENEYRKQRLGSLDDDELESLDQIEYDQNFDKEYENFYHQNLQDCLAISDIHIYNPQSKDGKLFFLTEQIVKYVCLMIHPGLITPTHIERCMQAAYIARLNSGCLSRQVGAVITGTDYSIKAVGWNDIPEGQIPCNLRCIPNYINNKDKDTFSAFELENDEFQAAMDAIYRKTCESCEGDKKRYFSYCFKDIYNGMKKKDNQVYTRSLHAEENAFLQIVKSGGQGIKGGKLFTTASPCELCAKKAYQLGIKEIFYIDPYPGISIQHTLTFGDKNNPQMNLFYGAIGNAYLDMFTPRMPIKDELKFISGIDHKKIARDYKEGLITETSVKEIHNIKKHGKLTFISRSNIKEEETTDVEIISDEMEQIVKKGYWTGSSFEEFSVVSCDCRGGCDSALVSSQNPYIGLIKFKEKQKKGDKFSYSTLTIVKDAKKIMIPVYSQAINIRTDRLLIEVEAPKGLIENVETVEYADVDSSPDLEVKRSKITSTIKGNIETFIYEVKNPNLKYSYCIEWKFNEEEPSTLSPSTTL